MHGEPLREVGHAGLRRAVRGNLGKRRERVHAGYVEYAAVLPAEHVQRELLRGQKRSEYVEIEDERHSRVVELEEGLRLGLIVSHLVVLFVRLGLGAVSAGSVQEYVAGSELFQNLFVALLDGVFLQNVHLESLRHSAVRDDLLRVGLCGLRVEVQKRDLRAAGRYGLGHAGAEHSARSGHHGYLAAQINAQRQFFFFHMSILTVFFAFSVASKSPFIYAAPSALS